MCGSKCAWCENSMPTENGGWKCPYNNCQMSRTRIEIILRMIGGNR